MNKDQLQSSINTFWDNHIISTLIDYIKIPNKSPAFDLFNLVKSWAMFLSIFFHLMNKLTGKFNYESGIRNVGFFIRNS